MAIIINECDEEKWLLILCCVILIIILLASVPTNAVLLLTICKNKRFHAIFFIIVFNVALTDLFIAGFVCPFAVGIYIKDLATESQQKSKMVKIMFRYGLITFSMVSHLSMATLSIDRMISLQAPKKYRLVRIRTILLVLVGIWVFTLLLTPAFFSSQFITYFAVVSISLILITAVVMLTTYMLYRLQLRQFLRQTLIPCPQNERVDCIANNSPDCFVESDDPGNQSSTTLESIDEFQRQQNRCNYEMEKRASNTFFYIMLGFLVCYAPIGVISLYMQISYPDLLSNCFTFVLLGEIILILVAISSLLNACIILTRLTALRKACAILFVSQKEIEIRWRSESVPTEPKLAALKEKILKRTSKTSRAGMTTLDESIV